MKGKKIIVLIAVAAVLACGLMAGCSNNRSVVKTASELTQSIASKPGTVIGVWSIDSFIDKDGKPQNMEDFVADTLNVQYGVVVDREGDQFKRAMEMYHSIAIAFAEDGKMTSVVMSGNDAGRVSGNYSVENGEVKITLTSGKSGPPYHYDAQTDTLTQVVDGVTTVFKRQQQSE